RQPEQIPPLEPHGAAYDAPRRPDAPQEGEGRHRLAGAGLADHAQDLPRPDAEADAVHRLHEPVLGVEMDGEVADLEQGAHRTPRSRGSRRSRRVSPTRLKASTVSMMAKPGQS